MDFCHDTQQLDGSMSADRPFRDFVAVIKGAGELASGAAFRLQRAGFQVVMTELEKPTCISHGACFAAAMLDGRKELDGVAAVRTTSAIDALAVAREGSVAVVPDAAGRLMPELGPAVLIDGVMAKRNLGTHREQAPIVIGLGPGFVAGEDVHAVVETKRGHRLGRVITRGTAELNTGVPELIEGQSISRMLTAPASGPLKARCRIGDRVRAGEPVAIVAERPVVAGISGVVRGLLPDGYWVEAGATVGEIDPAAEREYCYTLSDRALAVGSGALAAILELWPSLSPSGELPVRSRGRRPRTAPGEDILGAAEFALLGLLAERPAHGYELSKTFSGDGALQPVCRLGLSQLYADLSKLESLGLVSTKANPGRPAKKVFAITEAGRRHFEQWLTRPVASASYLRVDFMAKLYFARGRRADTALVHDQIAAIKREIAELSQGQARGDFRGDVARAYEDFARGGLVWLNRLRTAQQQQRDS
jgi:xanthine dehydrogenase accessory factor